MNVFNEKKQSKTTSEQCKEYLKEGNFRFLKNEIFKRDLLYQVKKTSNDQYPYAIILSCIDSRVPPEIIFDQGIGDVFSVRVAGNIISPSILGSMEYACKYKGVKLVLVLGHSSCGAVKGACDKLKDGNLTTLLKKIQPAIKITKTNVNEKRDSSNIEFVNRVSKNNIEISVKKIQKKSLVLRELIRSGRIKIISAMYSVETGKVSFIN